MLRIRSLIVTGLAVMALGLMAGRVSADDSSSPNKPESGKPDSTKPARGGPGSGPMTARLGGGLELLRLEQVQKELGLNDEQLGGVKKLGEEIRKQMEATRDQLKDLSPEERKAKLQELRTKMEERRKDIQAKVDAILTSSQRDRFKEIGLQIRGVAALNEKEVADALKITDEQKEKLKDLHEDSMKQNKEIFDAARSSGDTKGVREKVQAVVKETSEKALAVLTAEQREQFEKMQGKKFEFDRSKLFSGPFGGQGGRRGPPKPDSDKPDSSKSDNK